MAPSVEAVLAS